MTRISILTIASLFLCCQCDPGDRAKANSIVHGTVGVLEAGLSPTLRYGVGIDLGWELSPHLVFDSILLYRGASEIGCEELLLLAELPPTATLFEDRGLAGDETYAYCLTVVLGTY